MAVVPEQIRLVAESVGQREARGHFELILEIKAWSRIDVVVVADPETYVELAESAEQEVSHRITRASSAERKPWSA